MSGLGLAFRYGLNALKVGIGLGSLHSPILLPRYTSKVLVTLHAHDLEGMTVAYYHLMI